MEGMRETQRSVPNTIEPLADDVLDFRPVGQQELKLAAGLLGEVGSAKVRPKAFVAKWDAARKGSDVVLSGGDATAYRCTARGWGAVLGTQAVGTGRCVFNFRIDHLQVNTVVGVALPDVRLNEGVSKRNVVLKESGELTAWGERVAQLIGFEPGDVIRFQVDFSTRTIAIFRNGEQRPEATVGGISATPLRPFAAFGDVNSSVTLVTQD